MVAWVAIAYAASALIETYGKADSAKKQSRAIEKYRKQQTEAAWVNYRNKVRAYHNQYYEQREAASYALQNDYIKNLQAKATAKASAAGGGVTGSTIDNLFKDYDRAAASNNYIAKRNMWLQGLQSGENINSARIEALNVINNLQTNDTPSQASLWLSGIGKAASAFAQGYMQQNASYNKGNSLNV